VAATVYVLCTLASGLCAVLLFRTYSRNASRLLLWSGLSFVAMAVSNALVFVDFIVMPQTDLSLVRSLMFLLAASLLLYGLVADTE
jgi:hypothetical protein